MAGRDRISELPAEILDNILGFLPIEEATRTTVLSTKWRDIWSSLTRLNFDDYFFDYTYEYDYDGYVWSFAGFYVINKIVMQHNGPIREFVFEFLDDETRPAVVDSNPSYDIDNLFLSITQKVVEEMHLTFDYMLPCCIFSCLTLKRLHLYRVYVDLSQINNPCIFPNVTSLCFEYVEFDPTSVVDFSVNVPMLESLSFIRCSFMCDFNITAPKLSNLTLDSCAKCSGGFLPDNLDLRSICTLDLDCVSLKDFVEEFSRRGERIETFALNVEYLKLSSIYFPDDDTSSAFIHLLQICPKLCKLDICLQFDVVVPTCKDAISKLLEELHSVAQTHKMLHTLKLSSFEGSRFEMLFIKGLLACFPTLEKVVIICYEIFECNKEFNVMRELLRFPRASTKVEIVYV